MITGKYRFKFKLRTTIPLNDCIKNNYYHFYQFQDKLRLQDKLRSLIAYILLKSRTSFKKLLQIVTNFC